MNAATDPASNGNQDECSPPLGGADIVAEAFGRHYAGLVRFVTARTRDPELAADIAQEAFLRLIREEAAGRLPDQPLAWLRQVALNLVASRGRHVQVETRWEPWLRAATAVQESPEGAILAVERDMQVREAVAGLARDERAALVLASHGFAGHEIARAIGRSEGATRTLMCRARSRLRVELVSMGAV